MRFSNEERIRKLNDKGEKFKCPLCRQEFSVYYFDGMQGSIEHHTHQPGDKQCVDIRLSRIEKVLGNVFEKEDKDGISI